MHRTPLPALSLMCLTVLALAACGSGDAASGAAVVVHPTPESVIQAARTALRRVPADDVAFLDLFHAETDRQRAIIDSVRAEREPWQILDEAMVETFGERYSRIVSPLPVFPVEVIQVTRQDGTRAIAACSDGAAGAGRGGRDGVRLEMVRVGDRWWISGATWEAMARFAGFGTPDWDPLASPTAAAATHAAHAELAQRIRAGEFATVDDARDARPEAMARHVKAAKGGSS